MAFGGALTQRRQCAAARGPFINYIRLEGLTLAARVGAFDITAADSGRLSTDQAVIANQTAFGAPFAYSATRTVAFGRGEGLWLAGDNFGVVVVVHDPSDAALGMAAEGPHVHVSSVAIAAGDLQINLHNRGGIVTGALDISVWFVPTQVM